MKNKNLLIGGAVVVGGLLFFYLRKRKAENAETPIDTEGTGAGSGAGAGTGAGSRAGAGAGAGSGSGTGGSGTTTTTKDTPVVTSKLSNFEVNNRVFKDCGLMPPSFKRKARNRWDECKDKTKAGLRQQGLISFNGLIEDNSSLLDFDGNIVD